MVPLAALVTTEMRGRPQHHQPVQRLSLGAGHGPAQAGQELGADAVRRRAFGGGEVCRPGHRVRLQRAVLPGAISSGGQHTGHRPGPDPGLPGAGGAVRELGHPVRRAARRAVRNLRRSARRLAPRHGQRRLLPGRDDRGDRARGQERDSDRRVRLDPARRGTPGAGGRGGGGAPAPPARSS